MFKSFKLRQAIYATIAIIWCRYLRKRFLIAQTNLTTAQNPSSLKSQQPNHNKSTIAYVITVTSCPLDGHIIDASAILYQSIIQSRSSYPHEFLAIVHPDAIHNCTNTLERLGYTILERDVPVPLENIGGDESYKQYLVESGCCGEKEFMKLWIYTLLEYDVVVYLDVDTIVLQPLDSLFDVMLRHGRYPHRSPPRVLPLGSGEIAAIPSHVKVDAFYTKDYGMIKIRRRLPVGVQGGFLVVRPNNTVFEHFLQIITEAHFDILNGWGNYNASGLPSRFYGDMTIQGIVPYYYEYRPMGMEHTPTVVELSRCYYNNMVDRSRNKVGKCQDRLTECIDCRTIDIEKVVTAHFTNCFKPWDCYLYPNEDPNHDMCKVFLNKWFKFRVDWEEMNLGARIVADETDPFLGYCHPYKPMKFIVDDNEIE